MGKRFSSLTPSYFKNFNIENRVQRKIKTIEEQQALTMSPRHPSTAELLKKIEQSAPNLPEERINRAVFEASKGMNVKKMGIDQLRHDSDTDKRPRKENEIDMYARRSFDIDYDVYGYSKPEKIRPGRLTLRQIDEFIGEYRDKPVAETVNAAAARLNASPSDLHSLLQFYKPLNVVTRRVTDPNNVVLSNPLENVFPNMKTLPSDMK